MRWQAKKTPKSQGDKKSVCVSVYRGTRHCSFFYKQYALGGWGACGGTVAREAELLHPRKMTHFYF